MHVSERTQNSHGFIKRAVLNLFNGLNQMSLAKVT